MKQENRQIHLPTFDIELQRLPKLRENVKFDSKGKQILLSHFEEN